jgi:hypothetical protein
VPFSPEHVIGNEGAKRLADHDGLGAGRDGGDNALLDTLSIGRVPEIFVNIVGE